MHIGNLHNGKDQNAVGRALKKLYPDYADRLFHISKAASAVIDVNSYDAYHKRVYGFLSEQKAETTMLIKQHKELLDRGKRTDASSLLMDTLKKRPDLLADNTDTEGVLKKLLQSLR